MIKKLSPGDTVRLTNQNIEPHFLMGDVIDVTEIKKQSGYANEFLFKTSTKCRVTISAKTCSFCKNRWWYANEDFEFASEVISPEEAAKAVPLPSLDEVTSFFGIKP